MAAGSQATVSYPGHDNKILLAKQDGRWLVARFTLCCMGNHKDLVTPGAETLGIH